MKEGIQKVKNRVVLAIVILLLGGVFFVPISSGEEPNLPPVAEAGEPYYSYEGTTVVFDASDSYDPEGDPLGYIWELDVPGWLPSREPLPDPTVSYTWYDDYEGIETVYVFDDHDNCDDDTAPVTIFNVDPVIDYIEGPADPAMINTAVQLTIGFYDVGILDTHISTIAWGDDSITTGVVSEENGWGTAIDSHVYSTPGVYIVEITIEDDDGGYTQEIFQYIVIFDPSEGFVTGGGWINSPEGAYVPDPTLTGKATFGFVSKYNKGQSTPTGNTEFQFHAAGLNFHSGSYDWLVVNNHKAMYKGTGTIDGAGNYGFMISVIDAARTPDNEDVDMFRMKIWDIDNEDIVYDNQLGYEENEDPTTEIAGGQIVIHKK